MGRSSQRKTAAACWRCRSRKRSSVAVRPFVELRAVQCSAARRLCAGARSRAGNVPAMDAHARWGQQRTLRRRARIEVPHTTLMPLCVGSLQSGGVWGGGASFVAGSADMREMRRVCVRTGLLTRVACNNRGVARPLQVGIALERHCEKRSRAPIRHSASLCGCALKRGEWRTIPQCGAAWTGQTG